MVSIILCTYNRATLLKRAITSVLHQTTLDWELIVIDDGSTDATHRAVVKYMVRDSRIQYFYHHKQGLARARNIGLRLAQGEYITFLDSDDEYAPKHVQLRIAYMREKPSVDMVHGGMTLKGPPAKRYVVDLFNPKKKIHLQNCHVGGTFFFKQNILKKLGGFRVLPFGEDVDFFQRASRHFVIEKVKFPTYICHVDADNRLCDVFTKKLMLA